MRTLDELERLYAERPAAPQARGTVDLLVVRIASGQHETPSSAEVTSEHGLAGDRWTQGWGWTRDVDRQLTLMMTGVAELVPHNGCKKFLARFGAEALAWINEERGRARKLRGINCRVIEAGVIRAGDTIEIER